jgi:hypothetical protein
MTIRRLRDEDGNEWQVYEVALPKTARSMIRDPLNLPPTWLCFAGATQRRRLSPVPDAWQEASPEELRRLLELSSRPGEPTQDATKRLRS